MNLFYVDAVIGTKYYAPIQGSVRECFFLGTEGQMIQGTCYCFYLLDVAGIGYKKVPFEGQFDKMDSWCKGLSFDSILADSVEDLREGKFVQAFFGSHKYENCAELFRRYIPELHWGDNTSPWAYVFDEMTLAPREQYMIPWSCWRMDDKGFVHDIDLSKYYLTKQECRDANYDRFEPITF